MKHLGWGTARGRGWHRHSHLLIFSAAGGVGAIMRVATASVPILAAMPLPGWAGLQFRFVFTILIFMPRAACKRHRQPTFAVNITADRRLATHEAILNVACFHASRCVARDVSHLSTQQIRVISTTTTVRLLSDCCVALAADRLLHGHLRKRRRREGGLSGDGWASCSRADMLCSEQAAL